MISLYFHLPFCRRKCPYCHFFVLPERETDKESLQGALLRHLQKLQPYLTNQTIASIYFGGGTPTLFGPERIKCLLDAISFDTNCEITIEANPEEVSLELMSAYQAAGINRVSMGVQTLDDQLLATLGRNHSAAKAKEATWIIQKAGISNLSIDLLYEIPGLTRESFQKTLYQVKALPITHLSLYNLTFEPNTVFHKYRRSLETLLPSGEENLHMLNLAISTFEEMGLKRYEISAFAKEGFFSRHNVGYWTARSFFGLGPSAFSYFAGKRFRNVSHLKHYVETLEIDFEETLPYPDNIKELLAVELRLLSGIHIENFIAKQGLIPLETKETIEELILEGFLLREKTHIRLTKKGLLFYDSVAERII